MRRHKYRIAVATLLLCGCAANPERTSRVHYDAGLRAEAAKDYVGARGHYEKALEEARSAGLPQNYISAATYDYARMVGYTCDYPRAEQLLVEALRLEESLPAPGAGFVTKRLSELARLSYDAGKYGASVGYYERAIPQLEGMRVVEMDPVGFAIYLEDYASALEKAGNGPKAAKARARATSIRSANQGVKPGFVPVHYRTVCNK